MFRRVPLSTIRSFLLYTHSTSRIRMFHPDPARKLSSNQYDIYHCCVYIEKLLMMDKGTVQKHIVSFQHLKNWEISASSWFYYKKINADITPDLIKRKLKCCVICISFHFLLPNFTLGVTQTEQCSISNCAQASFILLSHRISHTYLSCYVSSPCHQGLDKLIPYRHHFSLSMCSLFNQQAHSARSCPATYLHPLDPGKVAPLHDMKARWKWICTYTIPN